MCVCVCAITRCECARVVRACLCECNVCMRVCEGVCARARVWVCASSLRQCAKVCVACMRVCESTVKMCLCVQTRSHAHAYTHTHTSFVGLCDLDCVLVIKEELVVGQLCVQHRGRVLRSETKGKRVCVCVRQQTESVCAREGV